MATPRQETARELPLRPWRSDDGAIAGGGTLNELLTAATGAALLVLLAALGVTITKG